METQGALPMIPRRFCLAARFALPVAILPCVAALAADSGAASVAALVDEYGKSVVSVSVDVTMIVSVNGRVMPPRTQTREVNGTVVAESGLTVMSLGMIDPGVSTVAPPNMRIEQADFSKVEIHLPDGLVIPSRVVLRRDDLGLVFVVPDSGNERAIVYSPVMLENAAQPALLTTYFEISRAPKAQRRAIMVRTVEVAGIVEPASNTPGFILTAHSVAQGCPIFCADGRILGIGAVFAGEGPIAPGFLPAAEVWTAAKEAIERADSRGPKSEAPLR